MTKTRLWYVLAGALAFAVLVVGWFALVSPRRDDAAAMRDQTDAQEQQNIASTKQVAQLKTAYAQLPALKAKLAAIHLQVPADAALPELLRSITATAAAAGVTLTTVNPGTVVPATGAGASSGLSVVPLQIVSSGTYAANTRFVRGLEAMPRALLIGQVSTAKDATVATGDTVTLTVQATAFVATAPAAPAAAPANPGAAAPAS